MFSLLTFLISVVFKLLRSKKNLLLQVCLYKKELEILNRQNKKKRLKFYHSDRIILSILNRMVDIKESFSIVKPETVLRWQEQLIKQFWTYTINSRKGQPPVEKEVKQIILNMKNDNLYWGYKKIQGELLKLGIDLDQKTKRFYVYFILYHKTREIFQIAITTYPTREFVRQQLIEFEQKFDHVVYMIHDNAAQFNLNYIDYWIKGIKTSVESPNMNAIAERFVGSVRREVLDFYMLINEKQIYEIIKSYIDYYNSKRPHQGLQQSIPSGYAPQRSGRVHKIPILGGLCHHYLRRAV